jgi:HlyD family secretion protein
VNADQLKNLQIQPGERHRPRRPFWLIVMVVAGVLIAAVFLAWPRASDRTRVMNRGMKPATNSSTSTVSGTANSSTNSAGASSDDVILTVSGYIINRARIEISPRFLGVVKWIGVKKGDPVTNGQVVVTLDDTEYRARVAEAEARLASAKTAVQRAELNYARIDKLARTDIESKEREDDARLQLESDRAALKQAEATWQVASTYLSWCTIRSPIDGVVLEKLVDPDELVVPQSFGGTRGPSTALIAVADPKDLQVEIDVNEGDLSKIAMNHKCRVSPAAYPDHNYEGVVAEIAPEADRAKGTLQIKVQVLNPDRFLTPELSAKVEFLKP